MCFPAGGMETESCKIEFDEFQDCVTCICLVPQQRKGCTGEGSSLQTHVPKTLQTIRAQTPCLGLFQHRTNLRAVLIIQEQGNANLLTLPESLQQALGAGSSAWGTLPHRDKFNCRHQHFAGEAALSKILLCMSFQPSEIAQKGSAGVLDSRAECCK